MGAAPSNVAADNLTRRLSKTKDLDVMRYGLPEKIKDADVLKISSQEKAKEADWYPTSNSKKTKKRRMLCERQALANTDVDWHLGDGLRCTDRGITLDQ